MPIWIPSNLEQIVYTKSEIDDFVSEIDRVKANKTIPTENENICGLSILDGDLVDLGVGLDDLALDNFFADGGNFDNDGEIYE